MVYDNTYYIKALEFFIENGIILNEEQSDALKNKWSNKITLKGVHVQCETQYEELAKEDMKIINKNWNLILDKEAEYVKAFIKSELISLKKYPGTYNSSIENDMKNYNNNPNLIRKNLKLDYAGFSHHEKYNTWDLLFELKSSHLLGEDGAPGICIKISNNDIIDMFKIISG